MPNLTPILPGLAPKLITVGQTVPTMTPIQQPRVNFQTISEALDSIPDIPAEDRSYFANRYTILVLPGYYRERIHMKPWVNLVGLNKESVYVQPWAVWDSEAPPEHVLDPDREDAIIELSHANNITNLSLLNPAWATSKNAAIRGRGVRGLGLTNIDVFPASPWPGSPEVENGAAFCQGKVLELTGDWSICIITSLGFTYLGCDSFGVDLQGIPKEGRRVPQNADCHFINCFFDALFVESDKSGCVRIRDCYDVHIRNSFLRVNSGHIDPNLELEVLGAAVDVAGSAEPDAGEVATNVLIEGSSLQCSRPSLRLLNIGPHSDCHFKHSSTDSIMLWGGRFHSGDIPPPNIFP